MIVIKNGNLCMETRPGETVADSLKRAGIHIAAPCGGRGVCRKCKIVLIDGEVAGDTPDASGTVLACKAVPLGDITVSLLENSFIGGEVQSVGLPSGTVIKCAGAAMDIGTTTVAIRLYDLNTKQIADTVSFLNPQGAYGADVITRIGRCRDGRLAELHRAIADSVRDALTGFCKKFCIGTFERLVVSANTTMLHIFAGIDPSPMGEVPFTPVFTDMRTIRGDELKMPVAEIVLCPGISAFFGADAVAGLVSADIAGEHVPTLFVDVGTNGEVGLYHNGVFYCCSTAAGPALEGAEIECGTGGIAGAVNRVFLHDNKISHTAIGGRQAIGICGCGLVDAVAVMLRRGYIDETGAATGMADDYFDGSRFYLSPSVYVSASDIRKFQLAKSAVCTGIRLLTKRAGLALDQIGRVLIAGGMGFFIDKGNAVYTGLFPAELSGKMQIVGNTSLKGAAALLLGDKSPKDFLAVIDAASTVDLAAEPGFSDEFMDNMFFE